MNRTWIPVDILIDNIAHVYCCRYIFTNYNILFNWIDYIVLRIASSYSSYFLIIVFFLWILILKIFMKCKHSKTYNILQNYKIIGQECIFFLAIRIFHKIQKKKKCTELTYGTYKHLASGWFGQVCVVHAFSKHPILEQARDQWAENVHTKYLHLPSLITSILFTETYG